MSQDTSSTHVFYTHPTPLPRLAMGSVFLKPVHPVSLGRGWVCSPGGRLVSGAKCFLLPSPPPPQYVCTAKRPDPMLSLRDFKLQQADIQRPSLMGPPPTTTTHHTRTPSDRAHTPCVCTPPPPHPPPDPILSFTHPMLFSKNWFPMAAASRLREHLRALILQRMLDDATVSQGCFSFFWHATLLGARMWTYGGCLYCMPRSLLLVNSFVFP